MLEKQSIKDRIYELCKKAKYYVTVNKINNNSCLTLFPDRIIGKPLIKNEELSHKITVNGKNIMLERWKNGEKKTYFPPLNAIRPLIYQDIRLTSHIYGIPYDLLIGYNENNEVVLDLFDAIPFPENSNRDIERAILNSTLLLTSGHDIQDELKQKGILEECNFISRYTQNIINEFMEDA